MAEDAVVRALADPGFYPHHRDKVEHLRTHLSHVVAQRMRRDPLSQDEPSISVDTSAGPEETRATAIRRLWRWRRTGS